jgi:hypothetical protein
MWPEAVALMLVVLVIGGSLAVIVADWRAGRRHKPPER